MDAQRVSPGVGVVFTWMKGEGSRRRYFRGEEEEEEEDEEGDSGAQRLRFGEL